MSYRDWFEASLCTYPIANIAVNNKVKEKEGEADIMREVQRDRERDRVRERKKREGGETERDC